MESDTAKLAVWSCERAGTNKIVELVGSDTFVAFSKKMKLMLRDVPKDGLEYLKKTGISFQGTAINKDIYHAAQTCVPLFTGECARLLHQLRVEHGRKALPKGYRKLYMMCRTIRYVAPLARVEASELLKWVLEGILYELWYAFPPVKRCWSAGKVGVLIWKYLIMRYISDQVREAITVAGPEFAVEMNEVLTCISSYMQFAKNYCDPRGSLEASQGTTPDEDAEAAEDRRAHLRRRPRLRRALELLG